MRSERARVKVRRRKSELNTEASFLHLFSGVDEVGDKFDKSERFFYQRYNPWDYGPRAMF